MAARPGQLRLLEHDRAVDVGDRPAITGTRATASASSSNAVGTTPPLVRVGEVLADVAESGGAEQRVVTACDGVGVAVAGQAALTVEAHATEHERPAVRGEGVDSKPSPILTARSS